MRVAIVGAGISGLICARTLIDHGHDVTVFEKSRGVGGRMATRRAGDELCFDHGAQYFTVRDERFQRQVTEWMRNGDVARWEGEIVSLTNGEIELSQRTTQRFVGIPRMNSACRTLASGIPIVRETRVAPPLRSGQWSLQDDAGDSLGDFDWFISSAPAPQSAELLSAAPALQQRAAASKMSGCWAVLLAFDNPLNLGFGGAFVHDSPLSWIANNSSKPQRSSQSSTFVLHASPEWTESCIDDPPKMVLPKMIDAFWTATGLKPQSPSYATCHRWRFAIPPEPLPDNCLLDPESRAGACGDWCNGPRVEGAYLSGLALASRICN